MHPDGSTGPTAEGTGPTGPRSRRPAPPLFATTEANPEPTTATGPGEESGAGWPPPGSGPETAARSGSGSPGSPDAPSATGAPLDRKSLKKAIATGFRVLGHRLNQLLSRDELEAQAGLWVPDEEDTEGVSDPLSRIAARRGGPAVLNPDVGDAIAAAISLAAYVSKQLALRVAIRKAAGAGQVDLTGHVEDQEPAQPAAAAGAGTVTMSGASFAPAG